MHPDDPHKVVWEGSGFFSDLIGPVLKVFPIARTVPPPPATSSSVPPSMIAQNPQKPVVQQVQTAAKGRDIKAKSEMSFGVFRFHEWHQQQ